MVRVELEIPEDDQTDFARQARLEGMTLDAWLLKVARQRVEKQPDDETSQRLAHLHDIFRACDELPGPEREPDWEEFKKEYIESRRRSLPDV